MPIFEGDEEISQSEIERQQSALNAKVRRHQEREAYRKSLGAPSKEPFWMSEGEGKKVENDM